MIDRVELVLQSPAAVTLLGLLELNQRRGQGQYELSTDVRFEAVTAAVDHLRSGSLPELLVELVRSGYDIAGPWNSMAEVNLPRAFAGATARHPLARALVEEFGTALRQPIDVDAQEFWTTRRVHDWSQENSHDLSRIYCCGEFTFGGRWTVTSPHPRIHDELIWAWEMDDDQPDPVLRWRYPIAAGARIFEVHEPADWVSLVAQYPVLPAPPHSGWELPGPTPPLTPTIVEATNGHAARSDVRVAMPDWAAIARDYDGVHLSWFGLLTCEGHVVDVPELGPDVVTLLRYWFSERTLWLNDVFGEPEPLPSISFTD